MKTLKELINKYTKCLISLLLIIVLCIDSFASVVNFYDGSIFVTKGDFENLKKEFADQIDKYNASIDNKIDGVIAAYLAGIQLATSFDIEPIVDVTKTEVKCVHKGALSRKLKLAPSISGNDTMTTCWNGRTQMVPACTSASGNGMLSADSLYATPVFVCSFSADYTNTTNQVFITSQDNPDEVEGIYDKYKLVTNYSTATRQWRDSDNSFGSIQWSFPDTVTEGVLFKANLKYWISGNTYMVKNSAYNYGFDSMNQVENMVKEFNPNTDDCKYTLYSSYIGTNNTNISNEGKYSIDNQFWSLIESTDTNSNVVYLFNECDEKNILVKNVADKNLSKFIDDTDSDIKVNNIFYDNYNWVFPEQGPIVLATADKQARGTSGNTMVKLFIIPKYWFKQEHNGSSIVYNNLNQLSNGKLGFKSNGKYNKVKFYEGLPIGTAPVDGKIEFKCSFEPTENANADGTTVGFTPASRIRVYVKEGGFVNEDNYNGAAWTEYEKNRIMDVKAKAGYDQCHKTIDKKYIDIDIDPTTLSTGEVKLVIDNVEKDSNYYIRFEELYLNGTSYNSRLYGGKLTTFSDIMCVASD